MFCFGELTMRAVIVNSSMGGEDGPKGRLKAVTICDLCLFGQRDSSLQHQKKVR